MHSATGSESFLIVPDLVLGPVPRKRWGSGGAQGATKNGHFDLNRGTIMKSVQKGFTLIELMIVVAIIAILAAIAIPQYQTYVIRSQVTRVMGEAGDLKTAVEDCLNNGLTTFSGSCVDTSSSSDLLGSGHPVVTWSATTPSITASFGTHANTKISGDSLTWSRSGSGSWTCSVSGVSSEYAPASCQ
jgi:type IV pilus assembly protein PilA